MPNWITGFIGLVKAESESQVEETVLLIYYTCYVPSFDMVKIPVAKRACVISALRRALEKYRPEIRLVYADPYGAVNRACTRYKVNRNLVLPHAFKVIFQALRDRGLLSEHYRIYVDSELTRYINELREVVSAQVEPGRDDSSPVKLATLIASIPDVSQVEYRCRHYYTFRVRGETIDIPLEDIHEHVYRCVEKYALELSTTGR